MHPLEHKEEHADVPRRCATPRHISGPLHHFGCNRTFRPTPSQAAKKPALAHQLDLRGGRHAHPAGFGGVFNLMALPGWIEVIVVILIMDLAIWLQHLLSHKIPLLWRIHRVHHSDIEFDVTTAIRFHPVEIALSMGFKIGLVYLLGPAAWTVVVFEILLNGSAMFNHANIALPQKLDRVIRSVLVTPDMHRIHHSVHRSEHDSNYGFALSWWDHLFGTYTQDPQDGHRQMKIGLQWQDFRPTRLIWSLALPFMRK